MSENTNAMALNLIRTITAFQTGVGRKTFTSSAVTFADLKPELIAQGFDLNNMRVLEGNTNLDLINDNAILPTNIERRGQITNDLTIVMAPIARPKSGADEETGDTTADNEDPQYDFTKDGLKITLLGVSRKDLIALVKEYLGVPIVSGIVKAYFGSYQSIPTKKLKEMVVEFLFWIHTEEKAVALAHMQEMLDNLLDTSTEGLSETLPTIQGFTGHQGVEGVAGCNCGCKKEIEEVKQQLDFNNTEYVKGIQSIVKGFLHLQDNVFNSVKKDDLSPQEDELEEMLEKLNQ